VGGRGEWLKSLDAEDRRTIGEDIKDVEFAWPLGMPLVRSLGRGLWEVTKQFAARSYRTRDFLR